MSLRRSVFFLAAAAAAAIAAADAAAQSSPLSRSFGASPLIGGGAQAPALWYYGPSYSLGYDRPPAGAGQPYRPSLRDDPFYGPDFVDRFERGQRFGPLAPWHERFNGR